jgi:hypothetical protein
VHTTGRQAHIYHILALAHDPSVSFSQQLLRKP